MKVKGNGMLKLMVVSHRTLCSRTGKRLKIKGSWPFTVSCSNSLNHFNTFDEGKNSSPSSCGYTLDFAWLTTKFLSVQNE
jgi:hypothetical protein